MKPITIQQIISAIDANIQPTDCDLSTKITGISTDTRTLNPGDCFVAITGPTFDGHDHIQTAIDKGASCIISNKGVRSLLPTANLVVDDTIDALGKLAKWYRTWLGAKVVAITGSAGKTSTRHILHHVLSQYYACHQSPKSFNNNIGLPLTLLSADESHEIIIAELGSNSPGEIAYLTDIARPDIAMVTNISPAHLEGFGTIENIVREKASIQQGLEPEGKFIINSDHRNLLAHCEAISHPFTTFGTNPEADIFAAHMRSTGLSGYLTIDDTIIDIPLPGRANLLNALAAYAVCDQLDITTEQFAAAAKTLASPEMRLNIITAGHLTIINDCYNANPASMQNALDCLQTIADDHNRRSVFIAGMMGELGDESEKLHTELGEKIAHAGINLLLTVGQYAKTTAIAANIVSESEVDTHIFENTADLCNKLEEFVQPDDIILVKGSRSAKLETVIDKISELAAKL